MESPTSQTTPSSTQSFCSPGLPFDFSAVRPIQVSWFSSLWPLVNPFPSVVHYPPRLTDLTLLQFTYFCRECADKTLSLPILSTALRHELGHAAGFLHSALVYSLLGLLGLSTLLAARKNTVSTQHFPRAPNAAASL